MAKIIYTESYIKKAKKFAKKHPDFLNQYSKTLKLLETNPSHPSLRLHQLAGKLAGMYSVSINIAYRISFEFYIQNDIIVLVNVGSHEEIY